MVILNPPKIFFEVLIVICFGKDFVLKSILECCAGAPTDFAGFFH